MAACIDYIKLIKIDKTLSMILKIQFVSKFVSFVILSHFSTIISSVIQIESVLNFYRPKNCGIICFKTMKGVSW